MFTIPPDSLNRLHLGKRLYKAKPQNNHRTASFQNFLPQWLGKDDHGRQPLSVGTNRLPTLRSLKSGSEGHGCWPLWWQSTVAFKGTCICQGWYWIQQSAWTPRLLPPFSRDQCSNCVSYPLMSAWTGVISKVSRQRSLWRSWRHLTNVNLGGAN